MTQHGWFIRKINRRRWFTEPDWIPSWRSRSRLPSFLLRLFDAREEERYSAPSWLRGGEISGDCLRDLGTENGNLSIFFVPTGRSDLIDKIAAAMAAGSDSLTRFEYCRIEPKTLDSLGFRAEPSSGNTLDPEVNTFHHDIVDLSGERVFRLALELKKGSERSAVPKEDIRRVLADRITAGAIPGSRVNPRMLKALGLDKGP